jgi:putative nucleotidyltransferase with HDIG domain
MQELDDYIDKVKNLPPAPRILPELLGLLRKEDVDSSRVVELISYDPAITAAVLRLCNSSFFAGAEPADNLQEAVGRIGFGQVYQLVAAVSGAKLLGPPQRGYGIDSGELWKHSVTAAMAAQLLATDKGADAGLVFTAGLLHDIGKIVLAEALEHIYARLVEESQCHQASMLETEKRLLGVNHAEVGGRLLSRWKFPPNLVAAVAFHHHPSGADSDVNKELAAYVYLGNMISYFMGYGYGHHAFALRGRSDALEILGLNADALPEYMIKTFDKLQSVESLLQAA